MAVLAGAVALSACKSDRAEADQPVQARRDPSVRPRDQALPLDASEQARFDRERHPELVVAALGLKPGMVVADVGAGTGLLTVHLARAVAPTGKVVATDVDGAVLDMMASRLDAVGLTKVVERRVVAPDVPGLEPAAYDAILLAQVDHFFTDRVAWLHAAIPALKPGGRIVITNRSHHRAPALDAARAAGLTLEQESNEVPGEFIATFSVAAPAAAPAAAKGAP
jgi:ubiquinone/menaquinone biosynthesis C-methylase UbiE